MGLALFAPIGFDEAVGTLSAVGVIAAIMLVIALMVWTVRRKPKRLASGGPPKRNWRPGKYTGRKEW